MALLASLLPFDPAPSIFGFEEVKKGILAMLFGGTK
jgi:DNA replicative helicase MCM subunit Mcm2 (Cdc46/Mcm family)